MYVCVYVCVREKEKERERERERERESVLCVFGYVHYTCFFMSKKIMRG